MADHLGLAAHRAALPGHNVATLGRPVVLGVHIFLSRWFRYQHFIFIAWSRFESLLW